MTVQIKKRQFHIFIQYLLSGLFLNKETLRPGYEEQDQIGEMAKIPPFNGEAHTDHC